MKDIKPIPNKTNTDLVSEQLQELILGRHYPPGSRLPIEADLAAKFRVSRSTIREALKGLQASGILVSTAGKGTFVSDTALMSIQLSRFNKMLISTEQVKDLVELRYALEPEMARIAALRRTDKDIDAMRSCIDSMRTTEDRDVLLQYGHDFHRAVCKSTHNSMMTALHYSISNQLLMLRRMDFLTLEVYLSGIDEHQSILDAIIDGDGERAEMMMKKHLEKDYGQYLNGIC
ncbi:MAG: FadR family transcriptional regulator [Firmicutes bacterium]|nr:FadR family transcriptional regulator [Bacillota bacterium]